MRGQEKQTDNIIIIIFIKKNQIKYILVYKVLLDWEFEFDDVNLIELKNYLQILVDVLKYQSIKL